MSFDRATYGSSMLRRSASVRTDSGESPQIAIVSLSGPVPSGLDFAQIAAGEGTSGT